MLCVPVERLLASGVARQEGVPREHQEGVQRCLLCLARLCITFSRRIVKSIAFARVSLERCSACERVGNPATGASNCLPQPVISRAADALDLSFIVIFLACDISTHTECQEAHTQVHTRSLLHGSVTRVETRVVPCRKAHSKRSRWD